ncbi:MAG: glycine zipper 2TM domain-containing protein [Burkholderiales bacterium]
MSKYAALICFLAAASFNAWSEDSTDLAEVISVTPIKEFVNEPRRECWSEPVTEYREYTEPQSARPHSATGAVIGGVTGGVIGHNAGRGHGRHAATAAGVVIGAIIGDRIDNQDYYNEPRIRREPVTRYVERCKSHDRYVAVVKRYHVVYRYNGREGEVTLPYDPGTHVRIGAPSESGQPNTQ